MPEFVEVRAKFCSRRGIRARSSWPRPAIVRLDRAICSGAVPDRMARSSRTMAEGGGGDITRRVPGIPSVVKNIRILVTKQVEPAACLQKAKARRGQIEPPLAHQQNLQPFP